MIRITCDRCGKTLAEHEVNKLYYGHNLDDAYELCEACIDAVKKFIEGDSS